MGFLCVLHRNDGSSQRESMMVSVDTQVIKITRVICDARYLVRCIS